MFQRIWITECTPQVSTRQNFPEDKRYWPCTIKVITADSGAYESEYTHGQVTWFNALYTRQYKHGHACTHTCTHVPVSSLLFITSPNANIFGLPLTAAIMSQTVINAPRVHFLLKHKCSFSFCRVGCLALVMSLSSPSSMISLYRRSPTTASASISLMNRSRNRSRTSSAERRGQNHATPTPSLNDHSL